MTATIIPIGTSPRAEITKRANGQRPAFMSPHVIASDEATFIASALEARKNFLEGIETYNDHTLINMFIAQCSRTGSRETQLTYGRHLEKFREFIRLRKGLGPQEQVDERYLAPGDTGAIDAFAGGLKRLTETKDPTTGKPELAVSTYNCVVASMASFYKWCSDPTRRSLTGVALSPMPTGLQLKKEQRKAKSLNHEQLIRVWDGARHARTSPTKNRDEIILRVMFAIGCRASEMINIRWDDIHTDEDVPQLHIRNGKGSKERFVAIDGIVLEKLSQLRELQPESEWMLPNLRDPKKHVSRQGLWKLTKRAGEQAGIHVYPHLMRHSHATISYRETKDPKLVQNTLGHSDVSTTLGLYVDEQQGDSSTKHLTHLL